MSGSDFDDEPKAPSRGGRRAVPAAAAAVVAAQQVDPAPAAVKAAETPAKPRRSGAKAEAKPAEPQPVTGGQPPQGSARPQDVAPAKSGTTLTGAEAVKPVKAAEKPAEVPKMVDVRLERSTPFEATLVSKPGEDACIVAMPLRHLVVAMPPNASFSTTVDGKKLTGCFTPSHELQVNPDTGAPYVIVTVTNLTFDEGFLLPSEPRELLVRFPDGIEVRATWVERDPALKLAFSFANWHTTQRGDVQIRGRPSVDSRISQFRLRTVDGMPEIMIVFRPLDAFCYKCKSELRDGICLQCPQQPAEPVVTAPAPAVFNPFAVAAQVPAPAPVVTAAPAPAAVVITKPPVVTPPAPVVVPGATTQTATASPAPPPSTPPAAPTEAVVICKYTDCNTPRRLLTDKSCRKCGTLYPCAGCDAPRRLPTDKSCRKCGKAFPS